MRAWLAWLLFAVPVLGLAQQEGAPWPMAGQDRYGTGRAPQGPTELTLTPYKVYRLPVDLTSHAPAIGANDTGFVATWVTNTLTKFRPSDGALQGSFDPLNFGQSTPAIGSDNRVYFTAPRNFSGNPPGRLFAVDPSIMDFDWVFTTNIDKQNDFDSCSPVLGPDGDLLVCSNTGNAWRVNRINGSAVWNRPGLAGPFQKMVMSRDDTKVFVANGNNLTALDYITGAVVWSFNAGSFVGTPGVATDGKVVFGTDSGTVFAIHPDTALPQWSFTTLSALRGAPAFSEHNAYLAGEDRRVYCFRTSDGARLWSYTAPNQFKAGPVIGSTGLIFAATRNGEVICLNPDGSLRWQANSGREVRGPMSLDDLGRLYVPQASNGNGVLVIGQTYIIPPLDAFSMAQGQLISGGLAELAAVDQGYVVGSPGPVFDVSVEPVQLEIGITSPSTQLATLRLRAVAGANVPGLTLYYKLWDHSTSKFVTVGSAPLSLTDGSSQITLTSNINRFVNGTNRSVKLRLAVKSTAPITNFKYQVRVDWVQGEFVPTFVP